MKGSKFDRDILVDQIANMRIKGAATKTILDFLQTEIGYKQAESYEILRDAQNKIKEMYQDANNTAFEESLSRLEKLSESTSDKKLKLEIEKEMNKMKGLYKPQKLDVTTDGKSITDITIRIIDGPEELGKD